MRNADKALYSSKENSRNRYTFYRAYQESFIYANEPRR